MIKIFKTSAPKQRINQFKIEDPYLKFFIFQHENLIDWEKVKSIDDVNNQIYNLRDQLEQKIDPQSEDNNYIKDIDMEKYFRNNQQHPDIQRTKQIYQQDPQKAKQMMIDHINEEKENVFNEWWNYMVEENDLYVNNPAFSYRVLERIINSSTEDRQQAPVGLNHLALSNLFDELKTNKQVNILKFYQQNLSNVESEGMETSVYSSQNGWLRIPSKSNDLENFESNIEKLKNFSKPNGWCTGGDSVANDYLSKGDFWLYLDSGKAKVAIRFERNEIREIQGP